MYDDFLFLRAKQHETIHGELTGTYFTASTNLMEWLQKGQEIEGRMFANGPVDLGSIPGHVIPKTFKIVLETSLLNTQQNNWSNPGKGVAPSPTPRCST